MKIKSLFLKMNFVLANSADPDEMLQKLVTHLVGLLRVSEYSDIRGSEYKIEYGYSSLLKSLDRNLFFFLPFLTETRSFHKIIH